jgi:regulator of protease activity HflC (stomatin/prohibitin superfamily)
MGKLILAAVLIIGGLGIGRIVVSMAAHAHDTFNRKLPLVAIGRGVQGAGVLLGLLVLALSSFVVVDAGHVGVVTVFGNVEKDPLYNGLHLVMPYKDVVQMDTRVQKHEAKYDAASVDIQAVHAVMALNFRLIGERAPEVYRTVGLRYEQSIIDPAAAEVLKANTAVHAANDILQQRPRIKADVQDGLTKWLAKYGLQVTEVSIKDIRFDKDFEQAVERKQIAQQVAEQKRYEVDQAKREAESKVAKERGEGAAVQARAEGEAAAMRLRAAAEAEYNTKVTQSLTPVMIQQQYLTKWDGRLPQFVTGTGSNLLLQIPTPGRAQADK